jgi:hypothetical protein
MKKLQIQKITELIKQHGRDWKEHVGKMNSDMILKKILKYQPCSFMKQNCYLSLAQ